MDLFKYLYLTSHSNELYKHINLDIMVIIKFAKLNQINGPETTNYNPRTQGTYNI